MAFGTRPLMLAALAACLPLAGCGGEAAPMEEAAEGDVSAEAATVNGQVIYVSDVVDALLRIMRAEPNIGPVNVGSDTEILMKDVAGDIIKLAESASEIVYEAAPEFLTQMVIPDLTKARNQLSWIPLVRLDDGLAKTIDYVRANKLLLTNAE